MGKECRRAFVHQYVSLSQSVKELHELGRFILDIYEAFSLI